MSNILISGINGFVGSNLGEYLKNYDYTISSLSRVQDKKTPSFAWDNISRIKEADIDVYIHLAGKAHDLKNASDPKAYFEVNTELTKRLFDVFLQSSAATFIYFSSVKAAADKVEGILYEDIVPEPQTPYGQSKQQAEAYLLMQRLPAGKRLFILRPCMIHGPGNKGNLNLLYKFVQKGIPYPLAAYNNERSFLSINNLNSIVSKIIGDPSIPGGIYNLADDVPLSTNSVIKIIAQVNEVKPKLWKVNKGIINLMAKVGDKLHLPLNSERLKKLTESYVVSNNKIKTALNIAKLPLSSEDGLKITIQSFHSS